MCFSPTLAHTFTKPWIQLNMQHTCCAASKALSAFCSIAYRGRECLGTKVWRATRRPSRFCFTMSSCERAPVGAASPPPPLPSQVLSPFSCPQWTLGISHPKLVSSITKNPVASLKALLCTHIRTSVQKTPATLITRMYAEETGNDKLSQVHWFWAVCMIWSWVVDIKTFRLFYDAVFVQKCSKTLILLCFWVENMFLTLCQMQHIASYQLWLHSKE